VALAIVDFHFLVVSDREFQKAGSFQTFYSLYNLAATIAAIAIQTFLTGRLIGRIQLKNTFVILPVVVLGSVMWMLVLPGIISVILGVILPRLVRGTIDESSRKSFQSLVPEERRGRVSMFMDSYLFAFGAIAGCLVIGAVVLLEFSSATAAGIYLSVAAITAAIAIGAIMRMRSVYDTSLLNWRLKRRRRASTVLDKLEF
jgi:MFS family permease